MGTRSKQGPDPPMAAQPALLSTPWPCLQILNRYDIAVIQEVRDSHLTAVGRLLDVLNQWVMVMGS